MIDIYTDGACQGNPGPGGWGAIIVQDGRRTELSGRVEGTTNNRMELQAAIEGLARTPEGAEVALHSDSQYLINTMTRGWKRQANVDLWQNLDALVAKRTVSWKPKVKSSAPLPNVTETPTAETRIPNHGVARYVVPNASLRDEICNQLVQHFTVLKNQAEKAQWALQISDENNQVRATMYSTGVLLIQGKATELWDRVCSLVEAFLTPQVKEIASRFVSQSEEQTEKFQRLFSPKLVSEAEACARKSLGEAYEFLADHDKRYVTSAFCLNLADLELPEYSAIVMPFSKAFEGYLKKLLIYLELTLEEELEKCEVGQIFDPNRSKTKEFISKRRLNKNMLEMLKGELPFSRHFLMHSHPSEATNVKTKSDAARYLDRLADSIKRSHRALVLER